MAGTKTPAIQPAKGKLGVMTVGMGAVATTLIAGVEAVRKGLAKPIGSLTQMGTIRLGKRTDNRPRSSRTSSRSPTSTTSSSPAGTSSPRTCTRPPATPPCSTRTTWPASSPSSRPSSPCPRSSTSTTSSGSRHQRQEGQEQVRPRRAARGRHPELQVPGRPRRRDLVRLDRDLPRARRRPASRSRPSKRASTTTTPTSRPRRSTPTPRSRRASPSPTARPTSPSTCPA